MGYCLVDVQVVVVCGCCLMDDIDCMLCYKIDFKFIGLSYEDIVKKYWGDKEMLVVFVSCIINGSSGVWG